MQKHGLIGNLLRLMGAVCLFAGLTMTPAHARSFWHPFSDAPAQQPQPETRSTEASNEISADALPTEARQVLQTVRRGGPFAYPKDGIVFGNREKLLPYRPRGFYTEYTVHTPGARNRGARRIIAGGDPQTSGIYYYTEDHYQSFKRIRE